MKPRRLGARSIISAIAVYDISAFIILALNAESFDFVALAIGVGLALFLVAQYVVLSAIFRSFDRYALLIANFLTSVGVTMLYRISPEIAFKQLIWFAAGVVSMIIAAALIRWGKRWPRLEWLYILLSLALLATSLMFGRETYGAKNWITLFGFGFQPSELVKILFILTLSCELSRARTGRALLPAALYVIICLVILLLQKDLGAAMLLALCAIAMLYAATGKKLLTAAAIAATCLGAVAAYYLFSHVRVRVGLWQNPWAMYDGRGYQIVQGLIAIASGGLFGLGLTKGMPGALPARHTDYIYAVICEEFGLIFGILIVAIYLVFIIRGAIISMDSRNSFDALTAIGSVSILTLQCFIIIGGVTKMIPLTGITLPFVSYGGSSMISCFILLGILEGLAAKNAAADRLEFTENNIYTEQN